MPGFPFPMPEPPGTPFTLNLRGSAPQPVHSVQSTKPRRGGRDLPYRLNDPVYFLLTPRGCLAWHTEHDRSSASLFPQRQIDVTPGPDRGM